MFPSESAEVFEVLLVGATGGAVLGSQQLARVTISKSDSPSGVVRFLNESLITVDNPNSTRKLSLVLERAGGLVGNATVRQTISHITSVSLEFFIMDEFKLVLSFTGRLDHPRP